jgi:hypothetical protein
MPTDPFDKLVKWLASLVSIPIANNGPATGIPAPRRAVDVAHDLLTAELGLRALFPHHATAAAVGDRLSSLAVALKQWAEEYRSEFDPV